MFFGHVIKAQPHRSRALPALVVLQFVLTPCISMKMLDAMLQQNIRFIDYEAIRARSADGRCILYTMSLCILLPSNVALVTVLSPLVASLESQVLSHRALCIVSACVVINPSGMFNILRGIGERLLSQGTDTVHYGLAHA
jgi:hypothetical protein